MIETLTEIGFFLLVTAIICIPIGYLIHKLGWQSEVDFYKERSEKKSDELKRQKKYYDDLKEEYLRLKRTSKDFEDEAYTRTDALRSCLDEKDKLQKEKSTLIERVMRLESQQLMQGSIGETAPAKAHLTTSELSLSDIGDGSEDQADNLQDINGIGPKIEKQLNEMGIFNFKQLASLSQHDIAKITDAIGTFQGRIQRDQWIEQADRLFMEKYG